ncbi:methyl-accepting chemotaxis protein [Sagittula marina]|uniref:Methyl-accepting chemotaxis protein n=1 Tax=Sagittula marina TaxID=943940 RepID=A0A7W6DL81_9RHOB|nr:hypothetical protein [Sagittula marina]MBB3985285.1 methyl-accepting chemotaxis protein [Sagittula marina]
MFDLQDDENANRIRRLVRAVSLLLLPLAPLASVLTPADVSLTVVAAATLGVVLVLSFRMTSVLSEYVLAGALMGQAVLLVAVFAGHPWESDIHMLFFVLLAMIALGGRAGPVIFAAAVVIAHDLSLEIALPALELGSVPLGMELLRAALHVGMILLETSILVIAVRNHRHEQAVADAALREAELRTRAAEAARSEVQTVRARTGIVLRGMQSAFAQLRAKPAPDPVQAPSVADEANLTDELDLTITGLRQAFRDMSEVISAFSSDSLGAQPAFEELQRMSAMHADVVAQMSIATREIAADMAVCMSAAENLTPRQMAARGPCPMDECSRQIIQISELIQDISLQADMLALITEAEAKQASGAQNAQIARIAGEARGLYRTTAEAALSIQNIIGRAARFAMTHTEMTEALRTILSNIVNQSETTRTLTASLEVQGEGGKQLKAKTAAADALNWDVFQEQNGDATLLGGLRSVALH